MDVPTPDWNQDIIEIDKGADLQTSSTVLNTIAKTTDVGAISVPTTSPVVLRQMIQEAAQLCKEGEHTDR